MTNTLSTPKPPKEVSKPVRERKVYKSVIHKECGGEIVVVSNGKDWKMACKKCSELWDVSMPGLMYPTKAQLADDMEVIV